MTTRALDLMHLGKDRVICAYELHDGLIVDPGPTSCVETLIDVLGPLVPRALMLTHVHLDHAGAAGTLARRFPELKVFVHEVGAPHLLDPTKLVESASRLYGDAMERLWGDVEPVPEEQIHVLRGGESVEGLLVAPTPGHASHHVSYLSTDSGDAFVGDVAGVRIPPHEHTRAPTPPPEIDVEVWLDSLHTVAAWDPAALCLTHFGRVTDVEDQLHRVRTSLLDNADLARRAGEEAFIREVDAAGLEATDEVAAERLRQAAPTDQLYMGLERYWRKRAERGAAA
ncbi:MAG: MBL fold metallo-hydrolase [Actinomycetota bacterium]|nr:MBL fold metallo-hydrolase [Actinomycetota bacterium]